MIILSYIDHVDFVRKLNMKQINLNYMVSVKNIVRNYCMISISFVFLQRKENN